jgi:peptidyl-tRNA hydrolase, PTH1 family
MKYLIACLGNIGVEYEKTRHNIGFMVADKLASKFDVKFDIDKLVTKTEFSFKSRKIIVIKPTTYMNLSGKAVNYWLTNEKISKENLLVITDDIALPFGVLRIKPKGSDGGHNGLKNINEMLQSQEYARLRMGVGSNFGKGRQVEYVLGNFSIEEQLKLSGFIERAVEATLAFTTIGLAHTMTAFNKN